MDEDARLTIGDLAAGGLRLGLYCAACGRFRYMKTDRFEATSNVRALAGALRCARCLSNEVATKPVRRDARTDRWPAESA